MSDQPAAPVRGRHQDPTLPLVVIRVPGYRDTLAVLDLDDGRDKVRVRDIFRSNPTRLWLPRRAVHLI